MFSKFWLSILVKKKESAKLRVLHSLIEFLQVAYKLG
jgi:hypothetical protein